MTNKEKIAKLENVVQECFSTMKKLADLTVCEKCNSHNQKLVDEIISNIENCIKMKKEIV